MREWLNDPATNRQLKVLKFFGELHSGQTYTKGIASRIITAVMMIPENRKNWEKYVFLTNDTTQDSSELQSFTWEEIEKVQIPDDWKPHGSRIRKHKGIEKERLIELATNLLMDGVPYDDPVPDIEYQEKHFCLTGKFNYGQRKQCESIIQEKGGFTQKVPTHDTDFLVIGSEISPSWSTESYGRKIEKVFMNRFDGIKTAIVSEEDWVKSI
tara:strand:+ start:222 stop:857 length:636 start_codon:yes stop_codon:yes gene_type:complete